MNANQLKIPLPGFFKICYMVSGNRKSLSDQQTPVQGSAMQHFSSIEKLA